jgi:hypothetical protein
MDRDAGFIPGTRPVASHARLAAIPADVHALTGEAPPLPPARDPDLAISTLVLPS